MRRLLCLLLIFVVLEIYAAAERISSIISGQFQPIEGIFCLSPSVQPFLSPNFSQQIFGISILTPRRVIPATAGIIESTTYLPPSYLYFSRSILVSTYY